MMRIAVIGPGAVGGVIAAWLAQNPELTVEVCARTAVRPAGGRDARAGR
jgi:2-dehydropantoate 2-reductase